VFLTVSQQGHHVDVGLLLATTGARQKTRR